MVFGNVKGAPGTGWTVIPNWAKKSIGSGMLTNVPARSNSLLIASSGGLIVKAAPTKTVVAHSADKAPEPEKQAARGYFVWPVSYPAISQYFGRTWFNPWHTGIDLDSRSGSAIFASDSGWVEGAFWDAYGYGLHIIINHGNGYETVYAHLSQSWVYPGQFIRQGAQIGVMGSTGWSTGPHLHFEIRSGGVPLNPLNFLH